MIVLFANWLDANQYNHSKDKVTKGAIKFRSKICTMLPNMQFSVLSTQNKRRNNLWLFVFNGLIYKQYCNADLRMVRNEASVA